MDRYFEIGHRIRLAGIDGEYEVKELAGKGASCIVYRTIFTNKDGFVTEHLLKEYNPSYLGVSRNEDGCLFTSEEDHSAFEDGMKRFKAGYKLQADIRERIREVTNSTSNIQNTFSGFGTQYIDMTLINGETYSKVQEKSLFDLLRRVKAITQVIGSYHKAGYLHLDIKPDNIFTIPETCELVVLFDFDSVTEKAEVLNSRGLSYTQSWAAPEQINIVQRKNICEATDLYAIGEVVFWKIFGRHSVDEEHWSFCEYDFAIDSPIFKNVNPKVFPILTELFHKTICVSVKERYQSAEELIEKLDDLIKLADPKEPYLVGKAITPNAFFIGRDRELRTIHEKLQENPKLFLSGIGGIGKSELAKNYAVRYKDSYDTILFATYTGSWMALVNDDSRIQIANFERCEGEKEPEYCTRKLDMLAKLCDKRTLFIIDNLNKDEFYDEEQKRWESILGLNCKFIFTTRIGDWPYPSIPVDKLERHQDLVDLYGNYCEISDGQQPVVDSIIEYVDGHTLTIELIAKLITTTHFSPEIVLQKLNEYGIAQSGKEKVVMDKDNARRRKTPFDHICAIFDMTSLSDAQLYIMANMALIPLDGIEATRLEEWCVLDNFSVVKRLVAGGWISQKENMIIIHPVVAEVALRFCTKTNPERCNMMLENQAEYLEPYNLKNYLDFEQTYHDVIFFDAIAKNLIRSGIQTDATAEILTSIPALIFEFGYNNQAIKYQQYALDLFQQNHGKHDAGAVKALNNLSLLYDGLGEFKLALHYAKMALNASKKPLWFLHTALAVPVATSYNSLVTVHYHMGHFVKALQYAHKALVIQEKFLGEDDIQTIATIGNLGMIYREVGNLKEAFHYEEQALSLKSKALGDSNLSTAESLSNLSVLYYDMGDLEQALQCAKKVLEIEKKHWGEKHASTASTFSNLSAIYHKMGDYEQAVQCSLKSLEIRIALLGEGNVSLATPLCNLGTLYGESGDFKKALQYTQQALDLEISTYGKIHPKVVTTLNNIAGIYESLGDFDLALQNYNQALHIAQTLFGSEHTCISVCLSNIGYLYENSNGLTKAEEYYEQAYKINVKILGDNHPDTKLVKQRWMTIKGHQCN